MSNQKKSAEVKIYRNASLMGCEKTYKLMLDNDSSKLSDKEIEGCAAIRVICEEIAKSPGCIFIAIRISFPETKKIVTLKEKMLSILRRIPSMAHGVSVHKFDDQKNKDEDESYGSQSHDGYSWGDHYTPGGSGGRFY
ncbi:MAG: hypothetical protein JKY43_00610 [Phycisphaerales bacterium]|nr:hypothetical protein [Phycisphaerales bacterium]